MRACMCVICGAPWMSTATVQMGMGKTRDGGIFTAAGRLPRVVYSSVDTLRSSTGRFTRNNGLLQAPCVCVPAR